VKYILEKAVEIAEEVKTISEWHRRMTHEGLNQSEGTAIQHGSSCGRCKVYFYRPPSVLDVAKKMRKAKHSDHYVGPAVIVKKIESRSFQISYTNPLTGTTQLLQRDAGMIILKKEWLSPSLAPVKTKLTPERYHEGVELHVGEMVIMMDYINAKDWYVAEIAQVLGDRFTVNGFTTTGVPLAGYKSASRKDRAKALNGISFHRTWCEDKGKVEGRIIPPTHLKGRKKYLWNWRIPIGEVNQLLLIRVQRRQELRSSLEVPPSCWSRRSGNGIVNEQRHVISLSLSLSFRKSSNR
jgi:hypothetical protein